MKTYFKNKIKALVLSVISIIFLFGCETVDLNKQTDPSELTPNLADPQLLLNNVQLRFVEALAANNDGIEDGLSIRASQTMRMEHLFGPYAGTFSMTAGGMDNIFENLYRETLQDIQTLLPLAEQTGFSGFTGIANIFRAYTYVILVDTWGRVPYTEALLGAENLNPTVEDGNIIYMDMLNLLDQAILDIENAEVSQMPETFFYEQGDKEKWIKVARTLQFKMYLQMKLLNNDFSTEMNQLIEEGLIDDQSDDFALQYLEDQTPIDSRHPSYGVTYDADGTNGIYMNNYYMNELKEAKGFEDPRLRYYFYRQTIEDPTGGNLPCEDLTTVNFCYIGDGYWGRDHGFSDGVPNDSFDRATYGLYPVGGAFDDDSFTSVSTGFGAGGRGIFPIMLSSFVKFMMAEAALDLGTTGNPRILLEEGIRASMDKVTNFQTSFINTTRVVVEDDEDTIENEEILVSDLLATDENIDNYIDFVLMQYDNATNDSERLNIIIKEYYLALWGNGYEAWNNYRRTSFPSDLSDHVESPGVFPRTFLYPAQSVNANSNISQKGLDEKTFWDLNPDNLD